MERRVLPREAEGWVKANCCCNSRRSDVYVLIKERAKSFPYDTSDCFKLQLVGCFSIPRTEVGDGIAQAMLRRFAGRCGGSQGLLPPRHSGPPVPQHSVSYVCPVPVLRDRRWFRPGTFMLLVIYCQENTRRRHVGWGSFFLVVVFMRVTFPLRCFGRSINFLWFFIIIICLFVVLVLVCFAFL